MTDLVPADWFDPTLYRGVQCSFYASSLCAIEDAPSLVESAEALLNLDHPYRIGLIRDLSGLEVLFCVNHVVFTGGTRQLHTKIDRNTVPPGDYVLVASPIDLAPNGESLARERVRAIRGALTALFGHTAAEEAAATLMLNADGTTSVVSPIFETFLNASSFEFASKEWLELLSSRRSFLPNEVSRRLNLALGFIERSAGLVDPIARFSNTWIALEIAASGKPDRLIKAITPDGGKSGVLGELDIARNDLFHRGVTPKMSPDAERALILAVLADALMRVGVDKLALRNKLLEIEEAHRKQAK